MSEEENNREAFSPLVRNVPDKELREVLEELHQLGRPQTSWDHDQLEMAKETISRMIIGVDKVERTLREISGLCHEPEA